MQAALLCASPSVVHSVRRICQARPPSWHGPPRLPPSTTRPAKGPEWAAWGDAGPGEAGPADGSEGRRAGPDGGVEAGGGGEAGWRGVERSSYPSYPVVEYPEYPVVDEEYAQVLDVLQVRGDV
jgi:hypothetical protein